MYIPVELVYRKLLDTWNAFLHLESWCIEAVRYLESLSIPGELV
jgi:hypothetical protein